MELGKGIKAERVVKLLSGVALLEGEQVQALVKLLNFRPMVDLLVVTNARVVAVSVSEGKVKYAAPLPAITHVAYDPKRSRVAVLTSDGAEITFKTQDKGDVDLVRVAFEHVRSAPVPEEVLGAALDAGLVNPVQGARDKAAAKEADAAARVAQDAADAERYGRRVESGTFGMKMVYIYSNGYVKVAGLFASERNAPYQRLLGIESSADVTKKSALGRGLGAVATGGLNTLYSNKRGDVYLTIVTDATTYALHMDPPTSSAIRAANLLAAAGHAVLANPMPGPSASTPAAQDAPSDGYPWGAPAPGGVDPWGTPQGQWPVPVSDAPGEGATPAARLRELAELAEEGLISQEEHAQLRRKILDEM
ncbi:SHOCT domain-containing protein [Oerskovia merdavium]|uniref:SHOCT domain-containing protein n=1 Tax=Oerskovia merdavium TaxID=2762227 RepID=A0ABR8U552_9CELL|nr:SHOCT domain-containing protein [Oerskovia merdavium]MBD7982890.1 SHOCT domain-containing protein [Oerskovia merdavium]